MMYLCSTKHSSSLLSALLLSLHSVCVGFISAVVLTSLIRRKLLRFASVLISALFFLLLFVGTGAQTADAYSVAPHEVESNTVWTKSEGPYIVPWPVFIPSGLTLTIEAGTEVAIQGAPFIVAGALIIGGPEVGDSSENVIFESVSQTGIITPEIDVPSETVDLKFIVEEGRVIASGADIQGRLSIENTGGVASLTNLHARSSDMVISSAASFTLTNTELDASDLMIVSDHSLLKIKDSRVTGGYIHITGSSGANITTSIIEDSGEIRIFDASSASFNGVTINGSEGFLLKGQSTATFNASIIQDVFADTAFNVAGRSRLYFDATKIYPLFSDFAIILDGSSLEATSTQITDMFQRGIEAIRDVRVSLFDTTFTNTVSPSDTDSFFIESVGSEVTISSSTFSGVSGNAIELYSSASKPYSSIKIYGSVIKDYGQSGIYAVQATGTVENTTLTGGTIGIEHIFSHLDVSHSSIFENSQFGAVAYLPEYSLRARDNFWGDQSGPYNEISHPDGVGDTVSGFVIFDPWLLSDPTRSCCSSVLFLPGLEASRLYFTDTDGSDVRVWEPGTVIGSLIEKLFLDENGKSIRSDIVAKDIIDEALVSSIGPNIYKSFIADMNSLKASSTISDWKAIPYDWRLSMNDLLDDGSIIDSVKELASGSKTGRVTIVAHSNGGILAKFLMRALQESNLQSLVDTLILVAVPQIGTPQAIGALLHGFDQGMPKQIPFLARPEAMRLFGHNMPGAYGLLPSAAYFNSVKDFVIAFNSSPLLPWTISAALRFGKEIVSVGSMINFLQGIEGRPIPTYTNLASPSILNGLLLSYSRKLHEETDVWLPPSTLKVIQIAGWGRDTVKGIRYYAGLKRGKAIAQYNPLFTEDGDGTVVIPSALFLATSSPNVQRYWLNISRINTWRLSKIDHGNFFESPDLRSFITSKITSQSDVVSEVVTQSPPPHKEGTKLQFVLHSDDMVLDMYDDKGRHTGVSTTTGGVEEDIPDTQYGRFGDVVYVSIPSEIVTMLNTQAQHYGKGSSVHLYVTPNAAIHDAAYTLDVNEVGEDSIATSSSFIDVQVSTTSTSILDIPETLVSAPSLSIDEDSNGNIDRILVPGIQESDRELNTEEQPRSRSGGHSHRTISLPEESEKLPLVHISQKIEDFAPPTDVEKQITPQSSRMVKHRNIASVFAISEQEHLYLWLKTIFSRLISFLKSLL